MNEESIELEEKIHEAKHQGQSKRNYHERKGNVKQKVGGATNNPRLQAEGLGEKLAGKLQKAIGKVEKVVEKP